MPQTKPNAGYKYLISICGTSALFILNAIWLASLRNNGELRSSSFYQSYTSVRTLLMKPSTIFAVVLVTGVWLGLVFWRSRSRPLTDLQKIAIVCLLLGTAYGYVLTAYFRL